MGVIVEFCRGAGMIEAASQVIDDGYAFNGALHLRGVGDFACYNIYGVAKLGARPGFVAGKDAHGLLLFQQFRYQGGTEEAGRACHENGHGYCLAPE